MISFKCISYDLNLTWWRLKEPLELNKPETERFILLPQRYETDFKCCIFHYCFPPFLSNLHTLDSFHLSFCIFGSSFLYSAWLDKESD